MAHGLRLLVTVLFSVLFASFSNIGRISDQCFLPTTPADETFSIWGFLYGQTFLRLFDLTCDEDALEAIQASTRWVRAWRNVDVETSAQSLKEAYEALVRSATTQCAEDKSSSTCCFLNQYATWAHSAYTQNMQMKIVYGDTCPTVPGAGQLSGTEAQEYRELYVANMLSFVLDTLDGHESALFTLHHAAAGICHSCKENNGPIAYDNSGSACEAICNAGYQYNEEPPSYSFFNADAGLLGVHPLNACKTLAPEEGYSTAEEYYRHLATVYSRTST